MEVVSSGLRRFIQTTVITRGTSTRITATSTISTVTAIIGFAVSVARRGGNLVIVYYCTFACRKSALNPP